MSSPCPSLSCPCFISPPSPLFAFRSFSPTLSTSSFSPSSSLPSLALPRPPPPRHPFLLLPKSWEPWSTWFCAFPKPQAEPHFGGWEGQRVSGKVRGIASDAFQMGFPLHLQQETCYESGSCFHNQKGKENLPPCYGLNIRILTKCTC